jgi:O-antigen ligase
MERLTFNVSTGRGSTPQLVVGRRPVETTPRAAAPSRLEKVRRRVSTIVRERYDWDYLWMLAFTALLFFRPQDHFAALGALHLAELTAVAGLAAMAARRMSRGLPIAKINSEVVGVLALGAVILLTIPFSFWPGGSLTLFSDIYVKIILIFALMMSTLTTPKRLLQMTWIMMIASGYIAARGVYDYARGVNLIEGDRLRGSIGGMFENPNDLALNLVTFMAPALLFAFKDRVLLRRLFAFALAAVMLAAIVFTKSRSGFIGLGAMTIVVVYYMLRERPATIFAMICAGLLTLPVLPQSFWDRMSTITDAEADAEAAQTGSRSQRIQLFIQGVQVFANNPLTGVGAGQFKNYDGPEMIERWRVTHNVWLQVAADLGIFGLLTFAFLVWRAFTSGFAAQRAIRPPPRRRVQRSTVDGRQSTVDGRQSTVDSRQSAVDGRSTTEWTTLTPDERRILDIISKGIMAGLIGWFACALFASVAFNWTFYFVLALAVSAREIAFARRVAPPAAAPARMIA